MMLHPIRDDEELVQCMRALIASEEEVKSRFLVLPESPIGQHNMELRRLLKEYLNSDKRLQ